MRASKLERYYQAEFGPRTDPDAEDPRPERRRRPERTAGRARGPGLFRLALLLGPMACLGASFLMPCGVGARPGFLPQGLVSAVCARQDVTAQILGLEGRFRSIPGGVR